jgi:hypothetical protein
MISEDVPTPDKTRSLSCAQHKNSSSFFVVETSIACRSGCGKLRGLPVLRAGDAHNTPDR